MRTMRKMLNGDRVHLVDKKSRHYALTLKAGELFQLSGQTGETKKITQAHRAAGHREDHANPRPPPLAALVW